MALDILIVDDERDIRELVAGVLSDEGYECRTAGDSASALAAAGQFIDQLQCQVVADDFGDSAEGFGQLLQGGEW